MSTANLLRLFLLAAIWGGSFLFMRIAAPVLGAAVLIEYRVLFASLFLAAIGLFLKKRLDLRQHWRHYLILGLFKAGKHPAEVAVSAVAQLLQLRQEAAISCGP